MLSTSASLGEFGQQPLHAVHLSVPGSRAPCAFGCSRIISQRSACPRRDLINKVEGRGWWLVQTRGAQHKRPCRSKRPAKPPHKLAEIAVVLDHSPWRR